MGPCQLKKPFKDKAVAGRSRKEQYCTRWGVPCKSMILFTTSQLKKKSLWPYLNVGGEHVRASPDAPGHNRFGDSSGLEEVAHGVLFDASNFAKQHQHLDLRVILQVTKPKNDQINQLLKGAFFKCANSFSDNFEPPSPFMQNDEKRRLFLLYGFKNKIFDSLSWQAVKAPHRFSS